MTATYFLHVVPTVWGWGSDEDTLERKCEAGWQGGGDWAPGGGGEGLREAGAGWGRREGPGSFPLSEGAVRREGWQEATEVPQVAPSVPGNTGGGREPAVDSGLSARVGPGEPTSAALTQSTPASPIPGVPVWLGEGVRAEAAGLVSQA